MPWFYLDKSQQQIQVEKDDFRTLLQSGTISRDTLVWNESMKDWMPLSKALPEFAGGTGLAVGTPGSSGTGLNPYATPASSSLGGSGGVVNVRELAALVSKNAGWIKFVGVVTIIGGVFSIPIGAVMIYAGIVLFQVANSFQEAEARGDEAAFSEALSKTSLYFKIMGIWGLVGMILLVIFIIFYIILIVTLVSSGQFDSLDTPTP